MPSQLYVVAFLVGLYPNAGSMALHWGSVWLGLIKRVLFGFASGAFELRFQPVWGFEKLPALWLDSVFIDKADIISAGFKPATLLAYPVQKGPFYTALAKISLGAIRFTFVVEIQCFASCIGLKFGRCHWALRESRANCRA